MHQVIKEGVLPLVGKVSWKGFNRNSLGSLACLQLKLIKHTRESNADKLKKYLALCIQEWPVFEDCPVNRAIIRDAVLVIENALLWEVTF